MEQEIIREIRKGNIRPVYFFYGSETFRIEETVAEMKRLITPEEDAAGNVVTLDLEETPVQALVMEAETPSFFGGPRLIIGRNAAFLTGNRSRAGVEHQPEVLISYLKDPFPGNVVVLIAPYEQLDRRKKVVKELEERAFCVKWEPLGGADLLKWTEQRFERLGVKIEPQALREFLLLVGNDLRLLHQECTKLAIHVGQGGTVTSDVVNELVPRTLEHDVFKLIDRMARRQIGEALSIWADLLAQREEPLKILALIIRQFRLMLQAGILARKGLPEKEIAAMLGVHPYPVKLALKNGKAFSEQALRDLLARAIEADQAIKSGRIDKELAVERLLLSVTHSP
jgi:DNA polymerase-3 subunit delta